MVILIAIILFGPKRIPELARQVGSALAQLRSASDDFMRELTKEPREQDIGESSAGESERSVAKPGKGGKEGEPRPLTEGQIRAAASKLGIKVGGKTSEELRSEMLERVYSGQVNPHGLEDGEESGND